MLNFKSKITRVFLILSVGIFGAYVIVANLGGNDNYAVNSENINNSMEQLQQNNGGIFVENGDISNSEVNGITYDSTGKNNLTQIFTNSLFDQVQASGAINGDPKNLNKNKDVINKNILSDVLMATPQFKTVADIKDSSLKISTDNSVDAKGNYLKTFGEMVKKYFPDPSIINYYQIVIDVYRNNKIDTAVKLANAYKNLANNFISVSVPSEMVNFHKEIIIYYKNAEMTYGAMSGYLEDPIGGSVALELGDKLLNEGVQIQSDLNAIIKKMNNN